MTTPLDPEAIAARIRAESRLLAEGLPVLDGLRKAGLLPEAPPLASSAALAFRDHDATLDAEGIFVLQKLAAGDPLTREDVDRSVAALARYHEQIKKVVPAELVEGEVTGVA